MSSTLGCLGLPMDDEAQLDALIQRLLPDAPVIAEHEGYEARRWTDTSGASLTMTVRDGVLMDLVPSYVAQVGARLGRLSANGSCVTADVLEDGRPATRIACELAQSLIAVAPAEVDASVTALGIDVTVHADATAFACSDASLLGGSGGTTPGEEPARFDAESVLAYGLFGNGDIIEPLAVVCGTVLSSRSFVNAETEQRFHTARIRTVGFTATVCLDAHDHPTAPAPGNVVAGICYLVVDVPTLW